MYDMIMTVLLPVGASYVLAKAVIDEWLGTKWRCNSDDTGEHLSS